MLLEVPRPGMRFRRYHTAEPILFFFVIKQVSPHKIPPECSLTTRSRWNGSEPKIIISLDLTTNVTLGDPRGVNKYKDHSTYIVVSRAAFLYPPAVSLPLLYLEPLPSTVVPAYLLT